MGNQFIWVAAGSKERADMVRSHRDLPLADLCELFLLTEEGVGRILNGADWTPAYSTDDQ